jgi:hypothetical protein
MIKQSFRKQNDQYLPDFVDLDDYNPLKEDHLSEHIIKLFSFVLCVENQYNT